MSLPISNLDIRQAFNEKDFPTPDEDIYALGVDSKLENQALRFLPEFKFIRDLCGLSELEKDFISSQLFIQNTKIGNFYLWRHNKISLPLQRRVIYKIL